MMTFKRTLIPFVFATLAGCGGGGAGGTDPDPAAEPTAEPGSSTTSTTKSAELSGATTEAASGSVVGPPSAGSTATTAPAPESVRAAPALGGLHGVNLSGAEFAYTAIPGVEGRDYGWPTPAEVDYFMGKGMNTFRVGFLWERMQATANAELTPAYVAKLDEIVAYATSKGAHVILNPHNFARYYGNFVGTSSVPAAVFADLWKRLAARYAGNPRVMFNLVNEPNGLPTEQWVFAANAAIAAIRSTGATNLIHVPGNAFTGAHSWNESWYGTSNAKAMLAIVDSADNYVFEVHQYLDATSGGVAPECVSPTVGRERMAGFIAWLRANGKKGFVGELAGADNATCNAAVTDMLTALDEASDVVVGWLWWGAGPRWSENYPFAIEPKSGRDAPQMSLLAPFLKSPAP